MKKWNGKDASGRYQFPHDEVDRWNMMIDFDGDILYTAHDGVQHIWCVASRLTQHLHHILVQIPARH